MKQGRRMDMVDARSLRGSLFCDSLALGLALSMSLPVSQNRGASCFILRIFHLKLLERTLCFVHLIASDGSRTSAELQHRVYCTFGSAGNLLTHLAIYGSSDPQAWEHFRTPFSKEFQPPLWDWLCLCLSLCLKIGVRPVSVYEFSPKNPRVDSLSCQLIASDVSRTSAELQHREKKRKHINSFQSLNDVIHWSPSTINVPSGEKTETYKFSPILERCRPLESFNYKCPIRRKNGNTSIISILNDVIHWSPSMINVPSGEKTETYKFSPILERCRPLESFNYKCPIRRKNGNTSIISNP
ncbi:hypothetical protein TNCV_11461 [Trichonephila clavipes]|nr:hypothetical protein TNCV_11461 [Trichonephila clavipes]